LFDVAGTHWLGQRIEASEVERWDGRAWVPIASGTTIGYKRLLRFPNVTTDKVRLVIRQAKACLVISRSEFSCIYEIIRITGQNRAM
jgi:alpha-L-fucosidase